MTNDEMRVAIAEACGWKCVEPVPRVKESPLARWMRGNEFREFRNMPDYTNDLNAMHEAEKTLSDKQHGDYEAFLLQICAPDEIHDDDSWYPCVTATAAQRAEAFLRTIGKWKE